MAKILRRNFKNLVKNSMQDVSVLIQLVVQYIKIRYTNFLIVFYSKERQNDKLILFIKRRVLNSSNRTLENSYKIFNYLKQSIFKIRKNYSIICTRILKLLSVKIYFKKIKIHFVTQDASVKIQFSILT